MKCIRIKIENVWNKTEKAKSLDAERMSTHWFHLRFVFLTATNMKYRTPVYCCPAVLFELTLIRGAKCFPASCRIPRRNCQCWHHKMPLTSVSREQFFYYLIRLVPKGLIFMEKKRGNLFSMNQLLLSSIRSYSVVISVTLVVCKCLLKSFSQTEIEIVFWVMFNFDDVVPHSLPIKVPMEQLIELYSVLKNLNNRLLNLNVFLTSWTGIASVEINSLPKVCWRDVLCGWWDLFPSFLQL